MAGKASPQALSIKPLTSPRDRIASRSPKARHSNFNTIRDGTTDGMIWQNQSSGATYEWTMNNGQHSNPATDVSLGVLPGWQAK